MIIGGGSVVVVGPDNRSDDAGMGLLGEREPVEEAAPTTTTIQWPKWSETTTRTTSMAAAADIHN